MKYKLILYAIIFATLFCLVPIYHALAEEFPKGLGHPNGHDAPHWYDAGCCSMKDCEPLPHRAVSIMKDGYRVKYISSQGFRVDVLVPWSEARVSQDGQNHGCASPVRFLCFYAAVVG